MEDERILKKIFNGKFHNTIPIGNKINKMEGQTGDTDEWRLLVRETRAHQGALSPHMDG
jgi:hypothetical protein